MRIALVAGAIYNVVWGVWVITMPHAWFDWGGVARPLYPQIWQCVGMIVAVYGLGYAIAATDPLRWWPIVLVGLVGKVLGPLGFLAALLEGVFTPAMGWVIVTNDLVWWPPFVLILISAVATRRDAASTATFEEAGLLSPEAALAEARTQQGRSLADLSRERPLLVVFLRHMGCTFCREALSDVARRRKAIEGRGVGIALVHMVASEAAPGFFASYGLDDVASVSDPDRRLYRSLGLRRGGIAQLLAPVVWWRGFVSAILHRHGFGGAAGDGLQMPGAFVIADGRVIKAFRHARASDRPDYEQLAGACGLPGPAPQGQ